MFPRFAKGGIAWLERAPVSETSTRREPALSTLSGSSGRRSGRWWSVLPFVILLPLFYLFAWENGERSNSGMSEKGYPVIFDHDQHSYLNMGKMMRLSDYQRVVPRHRMPGYAFLLSLLYVESDAYERTSDEDPRNISPEYFSRAKHFNIALSLLSVVAVYFVCRRFLPKVESHLVTWSFAWLVAVIRAPYVQPEIAFYVLFLIGFVALWQLIVKPRWWLAPVAALALAAAFLLKSTVVPLMALFLVAAIAKSVLLLYRGLRNRTPEAWGPPVKQLAVAFAVPVCFAFLLLPYFRHTAEMYGSALWDAHSQHYMWMDSDAEKRFWRNAGVSEPDFVVPPDKVLPTFSSYLQTHDAQEMVRRVSVGWKHTRNMIRDRYRSFDFLVRRFAPLLLLVLALVSWRRTRQILREHWAEALLVFGFFAGYGLLYSWYEAIGVGPRLCLALFLPALFFAMLAIHRLAEPVVLRIYRWQTPLRHVINGMMLAVLILGAFGVVAKDLWVVEGGR
ncbi:MAG: hypothetical protein KDN19_13440 [Verrucomicrobiae bacterium]|nr:hypothetical protein [Verrucomicrobiae bacterium]